MEISKKERMTYIDSMKGVAILLVIFGHSLMNAEKNIDAEFARLLNMVAYVAIPSFFFVNGYLYSHKHSLTPIKTIVKKFKAYYIPFVGFSLFFVIFHNAFVAMHLTKESIYGIKDYIKHFILVFAMHMESELNGPMWFLRVLLIMVCFYVCLDFFVLKIQDRRIRYIVVTFIIALMYTAGRLQIVPGVYNLNKVVLCISYFYLGVLIREFQIDKFIDEHKVPVILVCMIILLIATFTSWGGVGVKMGVMDLPGQLFGTLGVFTICKYKKISECKALHFFGSASLDIMCLHFLAFKPVSYFFIVSRHLDIENLSDLPILKGTHGMDFLLYDVVALSICCVEFFLRTKVLKRIKRTQ